MKRWGFKGKEATHGVHGHRTGGSIGQSAWPSRVLKGTKMAGHMGAKRVMTKGLEVVKVDVDRNLLLVKGSVPGPGGGYLIVRKSAGRTGSQKKRH